VKKKKFKQEVPLKFFKHLKNKEYFRSLNNVFINIIVKGKKIKFG
jgi:hypothetical protein